MSESPPMPAVVLAPALCPQCGAETAKEAEGRCTQTQDMWGEYWCAGEFDDDGISVQPTAESLIAIDRWIDLHGR